jgi:hypothetical protein
MRTDFSLCARSQAHRFALIHPRPVRLCSGLRPSSHFASVQRFDLRFAHLVGMTKESGPRKIDSLLSLLAARNLALAAHNDLHCIKPGGLNPPVLINPSCAICYIDSSVRML